MAGKGLMHLGSQISRLLHVNGLLLDIDTHVQVVSTFMDDMVSIRS